MSVQERIDTDLEVLIDTLPPRTRDSLIERGETSELLEVVLDLGREPEARFVSGSVLLGEGEVTREDLQYVIERIAPFGDDNRAGIERTLHRISAVRNRYGKVVGLTLRVGRAVYGTIRVVEDLIFTGKSVLLLGKPGVGKTTMLREVARVLADDARKRVIVVDTSNEIAGDGDIPHRGIGRARRMQVSTPALQHAVMIEAVENHMPEVIIVDEIGTELDANAARTIAERGVQLIATAHGNTLDNLIVNPTLADLVGGIQSVTLGDDEARRRRTQKTVLERRAPPTFDVLVEIQSWTRVAVHADVAQVVDRMLRGHPARAETRTVSEDGAVEVVDERPDGPASTRNGGPASSPPDSLAAELEPLAPTPVTHILPYGVNKGRLQQVVTGVGAHVELVDDIEDADLLLTTKSFYRRRTQALRSAEQRGKPVYVLRRNTMPQIEQFIRAVSRKHGDAGSRHGVAAAIREAEDAASLVDRGQRHVDLNPQGAFVRRLQHQIADRYGLSSSSAGREPRRHVVITKR